MFRRLPSPFLFPFPAEQSWPFRSAPSNACARKKIGFFINKGELWAAIVEKVQNTQNIESQNAQMQKRLTKWIFLVRSGGRK